MFKIVEKQNPLVVHCICDTLEGARYWLEKLAPLYAARGYFADKTLTPDSFTIIEA
jgi:murein endopeptidase